MVVLDKRYTYCQDQYGRTYRCNSTWESWARWLLLGLVILVVFFLCLSISCVSARRRRRAGRQPFYGTGWVPGNNNQQRHGQQQGWAGNNQQYGGGQQYAYTQPAPPYQQPPYRENQQSGIELQRPNETYAPPSGPPPGKKF